jgi:hypothetical protein
MVVDTDEILIGPKALVSCRKGNRSGESDIVGG